MPVYTPKSKPLSTYRWQIVLRVALTEQQIWLAAPLIICAYTPIRFTDVPTYPPM